jgi:hydrogenase maturation protein HypF
MISRGVNSPHTTSCGRLFDAVAALCGIRQRVTYEAQAAMELEAAVDRAAIGEVEPYPFEISFESGLGRLEPGPMWLELLRDLRHHVATGVIAARFHAGLAQAMANLADLLAQRHGDACRGRIALSGGVFQNRVFSELLIAGLQSRGLAVLRHRLTPPNDGGLSLGQAAVAAARVMQ